MSPLKREYWGKTAQATGICISPAFPVLLVWMVKENKGRSYSNECSGQIMVSEVILDFFFPPLWVAMCWQMEKDTWYRGFLDVHGWLVAGRVRLKAPLSVFWLCGEEGQWGMSTVHGAGVVSSPPPGGLHGPQANSQADSSSKKHY